MIHKFPAGAEVVHLPLHLLKYENIHETEPNIENPMKIPKF